MPIKLVMKFLGQTMKVLQQAIEVFMPGANSILEMLDLLGIEVILDRGIVGFSSIYTISNDLLSSSVCSDCRQEFPPEDHQIIL